MKPTMSLVLARIGSAMRVSATRAVGEDAVDLDGIGHQAAHLLADRG